jgi:bifunctional non-homologous end joining protein LigD/DNA ligase-1
MPMTDLFEAKNVKPMWIGGRAQAFDSPDYIYEWKLDGERCLAFLDPLTGTDLRNKLSLSMLPKAPELSNIHKQVNARCILDGELIVAVNGEPDFFEIERRALESDKQKIYWDSWRCPATFVAFDILYHGSREVTSWTVMQRKELLDQVVTESERLMIARYVDGRGVETFNLASQRNLEGVVAKRKDSRYYPDARTKDWIQCGNPEDDDFVACGYIQGENRVVSVVLGQHRYLGGALAFKGHVTLGVSPSVVRLLESHPRADAPAFNPVPAGNENAVWIAPDLVCTVRYMAQPPSGPVHQPVFKGFRRDKAAEECVSSGPPGA